MPTQVGTLVHYKKAGSAEANAALICYVHSPGTVTVAIWSNTGAETVRQSIPYVEPGTTPPKGDYCVPIQEPGAPVVAPTSQQAAQPAASQAGKENKQAQALAGDEDKPAPSHGGKEQKPAPNHHGRGKKAPHDESDDD